MKTVTITLTDNQAEELKKWAYYKKLTGNLNPDDDPFDALGLWVARELALQKVTGEISEEAAHDRH